MWPPSADASARSNTRERGTYHAPALDRAYPLRSRTARRLRSCRGADAYGLAVRGRGSGRPARCNRRPRLGRQAAQWANRFPCGPRGHPRRAARHGAQVPAVLRHDGQPGPAESNERRNFGSHDDSLPGGSPRFQLAIDIDGDGDFDGNAFGYVGHTGFGSGCLTGVWDFIDMTDNLPARWDLTQLGGGYQNWPGVLAFFALHPNHRVLSGSLVDDSCSFAPTSCGQAYYDLVTIENRTLENRQDTVH